MDKLSSFFVKLILVLAFSLFFDSNVSAADGFLAPDGNTYTYKYVTHRYLDSYHNDYDYTLYSNYEVAISTDYQLTTNIYRCLVAFPINPSSDDLYLCSLSHDSYSHGVTVSSVTSFNNQGAYYSSNTSGFYLTVAGSNGAPAFSGIIADRVGYEIEDFSSLQDAYDFLSFVDYEESFNPAFPAPDITVTYNTSGATASSSYSVPIYMQYNFDDFYSDGVQTFYETKYRFYTSVAVKQIWGSSAPPPDYQTLEYEISDWYFFDDLSFTSSSGVYSGYRDFGTTVSNWQTFLQGQSITFMGADGIDINSASDIYDVYCNYFQNYNHSSVNMGNKTEIMIRAYRIIDGVKVTSPWRRWVSSAPVTYDIISSYDYSQGTVISGTSSSSVEGDNPVIDYPSYGNIVINNNNGVPNSQNYPTIADFNRDKFLKGYIETALQLPQFFGQFGNFLADAFVFIPDVIWSIVALGFSASIIVMILKIL